MFIEDNVEISVPGSRGMYLRVGCARFPQEVTGLRQHFEVRKFRCRETARPADAVRCAFQSVRGRSSLTDVAVVYLTIVVINDVNDSLFGTVPCVCAIIVESVPIDGNSIVGEQRARTPARPYTGRYGS